MIVLTPAVSGSHQTPSLTIDLETIQAIKRDPNIQNIDAMIAWYQTQTNLLYAMRTKRIDLIASKFQCNHNQSTTPSEH